MKKTRIHCFLSSALRDCLIALLLGVLLVHLVTLPSHALAVSMPG